MRLKVIGTGSKGNCYVLDGKDESLLIECGVRFNDVMRGIDFNIKKCKGAIITHKHLDHSKSAHEVAGRIPVAGPDDIWGSVNDTVLGMSVEPKKWFRLGGFRILPFNAYHDVPCYSYMIRHDELGELIFATDTSRIGIASRTCNHIVAECNWDEQSMLSAISEGRVDISRMNRLSETHMSLQGLKQYIKSCRMESLRDIILIHLSDNNSNEYRMIDEIQSASGVPTYAALAGKEYEL